MFALTSRQHGNRSPLADPKMRGMIMGLTLDDGISDLAAKFNVTLEVGSLGVAALAAT
jgi:ribulose kinase